ncbi:hypothetical protein QBC44DRAFT_39207 [Cladorrhinum sp. PSN332]|nr:hypothetical protein QBC44DRAFT_39207 [Cladorrhinum sp. PSN332]
MAKDKTVKDKGFKKFDISVVMNTKELKGKKPGETTRALSFKVSKEMMDAKGKVKKSVKEVAIPADASDEKQAKAYFKLHEAIEFRDGSSKSESSEPDSELEKEIKQEQSSPESNSESSSSSDEKAEKMEVDEAESESEPSSGDADEEMEDAADDITSKPVAKGPVNKEAHPEGLNRKARRRLVLIERQKKKIQKRYGIPEASTEPNEKVDKELEEWTAKFDRLENTAAARRSMKVRTRDAKNLEGEEKQAAMDAIIEEKRALSKVTAGLKKKEKKLREKKPAKEEKDEKDKKGKKPRAGEKPKTEAKPKTEIKSEADEKDEKGKKGKKPKTGEKPKTEAKPKTETKSEADEKDKKGKKPRTGEKPKTEAKPKTEIKSEAEEKPKAKKDKKVKKVAV